jgi:hypothetical protein
MVAGSLAWGSSDSVAARDFLIARDGHAVATIVLAAAPSENARVAATELREYVRRISGSELPVISETNPLSGPLILVGASHLTEAIPDLNIPSGVTPNLNEEGFVIDCHADRLVLAGNDAAPYYGTRYAVVELLHRLGVRWFLPGQFGEVVPMVRTLTFPELSLHERPAYRMRNYW